MHVVIFSVVYYPILRRSLCFTF